MIISRVAYRYAEAIYDSIPKSVRVEILLSDFANLRSSIYSSRDLHNFFLSPVIASQKKLGIIKELFTGRINDFSLSVINFLIEKNRESVILEIIDGVIEIDRKRRGIVTAYISSFIPLFDDQQTKLTAALESITKKTIQSEYMPDVSLFGGIVVRVGDTVYDGSVSRQLQLLKARFASGKM